MTSFHSTSLLNVCGRGRGMALKRLLSKSPWWCDRLPRSCGSVHRRNISHNKYSGINDYSDDDPYEDEKPFFSQKCVNDVKLLGTVGQDPRKVIFGDKQYTGFSLATNKFFRDERGVLKKLTSWHNILVARESYIKDYVEKYVSKGARTYVSGYLCYKEANLESGQSAFMAVIVAGEVITVRKAFSSNESYR